MKIFLVGEGSGDIGELASSLQYRQSPPQDGFLQPLIRTIVQDPCQIDGQKITALGKGVGSGKGKVRGKKTALKSKVEMAAAIAAVDEADLLVYSMDGDNDFARRRADLVSKLSATGVEFAVAMPKATIESWALADENALHRLDDSMSSPSHPEKLWGRPNDVSSNHPKQVLRRGLGRPASRFDLAEVAEGALPSNLCEACPESFRPFADEMSVATGHLPCTP